jgi:hypothetical protein
MSNSTLTLTPENQTEISELFQNYINTNQSVLLVGSFDSGKTYFLNFLAKTLNLKVNHRSEIDDPMVVGRGKLPKIDEIIIGDECSRNPSRNNMLNNYYKLAIIATHHENIGKEYIKYLSGDENPVVFHMKR